MDKSVTFASARKPIRVLRRAFLISVLFIATTTASKAQAISQFAQDVTMHVLFHELAHALVRELDVPVLSNEEVLADAFATHYITQNLRDDAPRIIVARAKSWLYEDSGVSPSQYDFKGEHELDIRRAYQALCLFYGADPAEFSGHVKFADFSSRDLADCSDTAPDQIEDWAKMLSEITLPDGQDSTRVEVIYGEGPMKDAMRQTGLIDAFATHVRRFDWPAPITLQFDHCDMGASWSRSDRTILLCDDYVARFVRQGAEMGHR